MVHMVIRRALKGYDVEVVTAFNGQEGVEKARAENPALILMDVNMPVMGGLEALHEIRRIPELARTPIVLFTADGSMETLDVAFEKGVTMNFIKPFSDEMLVSLLGTLVPLELRAS
jgi:CheY-like chemotaxis protein